MVDTNQTTIQHIIRPWERGKKESLLLNISTGQAYPVSTKYITLGRTSKADIYLVNLDVSRSHAVVIRENNLFFIKDQGSTYGTRVNGKLIKTHQLLHNDLIQIGSALIKYFEVAYLEKDFLPAQPPEKNDPLIKGYGFEWRKLLSAIEKAAQTDLPVLVTGETGVGKELVAKAIFDRSVIFKEGFKVCNISAINKNTIDSSLFGHEKGAFTGAVAKYAGIISECNQGTLFLDEIGDLEFDIQSKLLRAIQFGEIQPVGGSIEKIKVRFIAATNKDLTQASTFRQDLYERFGVEIFVPPLKDRIEDIKVLLDYFIQGEREYLDDFFIPLCYYPWSGNIRSFEFTIKNALLASKPGEMLNYDHLSPRLREHFFALMGEKSEGNADEITKSVLLDSLEKTHGNVSLVIKRLKISRKRMYQLIKEYEIDPEPFREKE